MLHPSANEAPLSRKNLFASGGSNEQNNNSNNTSNNDLIHKAIDSLIVDYLKRKGCEFSLSVFLPESGLGRDGQALCENDVFRVLHVDQPGTASSELVRSYRKHVDAFPKDGAFILFFIYLKPSTANSDESTTKTEATSTTNTTPEIESRIQEFQSQLLLRLESEQATQLAQFKSIDLAHMRIEERAKYQSELTHLKNEYELRILAEKSKTTDAEETNRKWIQQREQELEKLNLELRQKLLEESHARVMMESQVRAEAEIQVKKLGMENQVLKSKLEEAKVAISGLEGFKERYATQTQEALADFKIGLNKEHAGLLANVEVEKAKMESEKAILAERTKALERRKHELENSEQELDSLREQLRTVKTMLRDTQQERDEALFLTRDLKLQVDSQSSHTALEFEIHGLKTQLLETERVAARRQEEYQNLLKGFMAPQNDLQKKWQRECQDLVVKLDLELNRNEELQQKLEDEVLRNKELKRDVSELKLLLHRINTSSSNNNQEPMASDNLKRFTRIDMIPNPRDILSAPVSPYRNMDRYQTPTTHHLETTTPPSNSPPTIHKSISFLSINQDNPTVLLAAWSSPKSHVNSRRRGIKGLKRLEAVAFRAGMGTFGYYDDGERGGAGGAGGAGGVGGGDVGNEGKRISTSRNNTAPGKKEGNRSGGGGGGGSSGSNTGGSVEVDCRSFMDEVLESFPVAAADGRGRFRGNNRAEDAGPFNKESHRFTPRESMGKPEVVAAKTSICSYPSRQQQQRQSVVLNPLPAPTTMEEIRKGLEESIKSLQLEEPLPPKPAAAAVIPTSNSPAISTEAASEAATAPAIKKPTLQELLQQEKEEEEAIQKEKQRIQHEAEYERRRLDRERRDREAASGSNMSLDKKRDSSSGWRNLGGVMENAGMEESKREKENARMAGIRAREEEYRKMTSGQSSSSSSSSSTAKAGNIDGGDKGKSTKEDPKLKVLNDLEADPMMQKYMAIVKEKREKEQSKPNNAESQDEKVHKILSALENTSLISSDESGKVISGETIDDISVPSSSTDVLDDPW
ncbi:hypothetical protein BDR26DRAFT_861526 [Obelidium mucronatum]|nr:hypothetical protein BDR26DRAFT_861526 [Obelidium mucronatum]